MRGEPNIPMNTRHRRKQARKLRDKLTPEQMVERDKRIVARKTVAEEIRHVMAQVVRVMNAHTSVLSRGFFGRLKWLVFGK